MINNKTVYLSGLNGLRAIAALSVLIAHVFNESFGNFGVPKLIDKLPMAEFGVTLFFVISGFLITYLLLLERAKTKRIDIKKFYVRRILRIWPLYYLFLVVCILVFVMLGREGEILNASLWPYLFFMANVPFIMQYGIMIIVHYWSIGVEEQFYLFWPWIVKFSKANLLAISVVIFSMLVIAKLVFWSFLGTESIFYRTIQVTRFHCMMVGVIGAIMYYSQQVDFLKLFSSKIMQIIAWSNFVLLGLGLIRSPAVIAHELIAIISLFLIIGQVTIMNRVVNLENRFFDFIGKISYGIYVIHPLVILLLSFAMRGLEAPLCVHYIVIYTVVIGVTIALAWLSYNFFEQPFLKFKTRFMVVQSTNTRNRLSED